MTDRKDFKKLVRERMAKTGESYTAARMHVLQQPDIAEDLATEARRLGIHVAAEASGAWVARLDQQPDLLEVGATREEATRRLVETLWRMESHWQNQVDYETANYLELTDD